jgi:hypothetical protein
MGGAFAGLGGAATVGVVGARTAGRVHFPLIGFIFR